MKKTFKVEITETLQKIVEVEAKSKEDAIEKVIKMYGDEEIVLDWQDFVGNEFEIYNDDDDTHEGEIEFFPGDEGDLDAEDYIKDNHLTKVYYEWDDYRKGYSLRRED